MKQKDLALIAVVCFISAIISFLVSGIIFGSPSKTPQQVDVVQPITSSFQTPDNKFFNTTSIDPTKVISIGQNNNANPFTGSSSQ